MEFLKSLGKILLVWSPVLLGFAGLGFLVLRFYLPEQHDEPVTLALLAGEIGSALLAGSVFVVILKSLQMFGVFRDAMSIVMQDENVIPKAIIGALEKDNYLRNAVSNAMIEDDFLAKRTDLEDIWKRVTTLISEQRFASIENELHSDVLQRYLPRQDDRYYENYNRVCTVNWVDESRKLLEISEEVSLDIVPTSPLATIPYEFEFSQNAGSLIEYEDRDIESLIIDEKHYFEDSKPMAGTPPHTGGKYNFSIKLSGKDKYKVIRRTKRRFCPEIDPYQKYFSTSFIMGARIIVNCIPKDLRVRFISLGTIQDFVNLSPENLQDQGRLGDVNREYTKLLFPNQGYILVFQRVDDLLLREIKDNFANL